MADVFFNKPKHLILSESLKLSTDTLKVLLVSTATAYSPNVDDKLINAGGANDIIDAETNVTNYTRGFGNSGRKTLASKTFNVDDTNDRGEMKAADITWTALGNGTNQTVEAAILVKEVTDDTDSFQIGYYDFANFVTSGANFTLQWNTEGLIHLTCGVWLHGLWSDISEAMSPRIVKWCRRLGFTPNIVRRVNPLRMYGKAQLGEK